MNKYETYNLRRINKTEARNRYNRNEEIFLYPCKANPEFQGWSSYSSDFSQNFYHESFEEMVNKFEYWNCQYTETGKYAAFYIRKG